MTGLEKGMDLLATNRSKLNFHKERNLKFVHTSMKALRLSFAYKPPVSQDLTDGNYRMLDLRNEMSLHSTYVLGI